MMDWKGFRELVSSEALSRGDKAFLIRMLRAYFFGAPPRRAAVTIRLAQLACASGHRVACKYFLNRLALRYGIYLGTRTVIAKGLRLPHPTGIIIGNGLEIGAGCRIYQHVTLGGAPDNGRPAGELFRRVGSNVTIYPGAKIIGHGRVGDNVIVGANAVVTKPFPENVVLAGVPARVIREIDCHEEVASGNVGKA